MSCYNCITGNIKVTTPPAIEPITLDDALEHCKANSGTEDNWFYRAIKAARTVAEKYQRRAYIEQTLQVTFNVIPDSPIYLPRSPVISVDNVNVIDIDDIATAIATTNYTIDLDSNPARLYTIDGYSYPTITTRAIKSFIITYTAGYGSTADSVPDDVKAALLLYVGYLYNNKSGEISEVPKQFYNLLAPSRLYL